MEKRYFFFSQCQGNKEKIPDLKKTPKLQHC